jgi:hypothetical protein
MSLSYAQFATRFPTLVVPTPSAAEQTWIASALARTTLRVSYEFFGANTTEAIYLMTAHEWVLYLRSLDGGAVGGQGAITAEAVGDWSTSYDTVKAPDVSAADQELAQTSYGLAFIRLRQEQLGNLGTVSL